MTGPEAEARLEAMAAVLALPVDAAYRPGVLRFLGLAAEMAAVLDRVPLDPGTAPLAPALSLPDAPPREGRP
jgi:hypothetical protein